MNPRLSGLWYSRAGEAMLAIIAGVAAEPIIVLFPLQHPCR